jgi:hypothetical protein
MDSKVITPKLVLGESVNGKVRSSVYGSVHSSARNSVYDSVDNEVAYSMYYLVDSSLRSPINNLTRWEIKL